MIDSLCNMKLLFWERIDKSNLETKKNKLESFLKMVGAPILLQKRYAINFVSKSQTQYNAPWWKLILSTKMCQQKCARYILSSYACPPYLKIQFEAHFWIFYTFLQILSFLLNLAPAPGGIQSKRLRTTHFFSGGGWLKYIPY